MYSANHCYAIPPIIDEVILLATGITFVSGGYQLNGTRVQHAAFAEGLSVQALNLDYFRLIGARITDRRTPAPEEPTVQSVDEATEPEIEAAIAAEVYHSVSYPIRGE